jgi:hypothetical protein
MKTFEEIWWSRNPQHEINMSTGKDMFMGTAIMCGNEYAKQQSIEFAKWLNKEGWQEYDESDRWICPHENRNVFTTSELYSKFLKS